MPGSNPLFGLNTLGRRIALRTKSGDTHPGGQVELYGGSFGARQRRSSSTAAAWPTECIWFVAGTLFDENGWRDYSPSRVEQLFVKLGKRSAERRARR